MRLNLSLPRQRLFALPLLATFFFLLSIQVYPLLACFWMAFWRKGQFVGLGNFYFLLQRSEFWESLQTTLIFGSLHVILTFTLGFLVALLLNHRRRSTSFYLVILFIPWILSQAVVGTIWRWLFVSDYGLFQEWFAPFLHRTLLADKVGALAIVSLASIWHSLALATILLLAALQTIPPELYENARLDGAKGSQIVWQITLPLLRPHLSVVLLLLSLRNMNAPGLILAITDGGPARATNTLSFYLYQLVWRFGDFDLGATLALLILLLNALLLAGFLQLEREKV